MPLSPKDAWKRILDEAQRELTEQAVGTWLSPAEPISFDGANLVLGLPDEFAVKWNEAKHSAILAKIAEVVLGHAVVVSFRVPDDRLQRPQIDFFVAPPPEPITAPIRTTRSPLPLNERYTFDSFVIGKSNELDNDMT